jgi:hypothetical protein
LLVGRPGPAGGAAVLAQHKQVMSRVFRDFPRGADDATKATWYRQAAETEDLPDYMRPVLRGRAFNHEVYGHFDAAEVTINKVGADGSVVRQFRVDGISADGVISVKNTQLAAVSPKTAEAYILEMVNKYSPNKPSLVVAPTAGNQGKLPATALGEPLAGRMILGIPVQDVAVPSDIVRFAAEQGVILRELVPYAAMKGS